MSIESFIEKMRKERRERTIWFKFKKWFKEWWERNCIGDDPFDDFGIT